MSTDDEFAQYPKLPPKYFYSWKSPHEARRERTPEEEERIQKSFFESMKRQVGDQIPEHQKKDLMKLGEKLHASYPTMDQLPSSSSFQEDNTSATQRPKPTDIFLEESLAYVTENVKAGLHPKYLNPEDVDILRAGFGDEWFTQFGYTAEDVK
jgi:hypothetical protein